jgi:hypothetical protein
MTIEKIVSQAKESGCMVTPHYGSTIGHHYIFDTDQLEKFVASIKDEQAISSLRSSGTATKSRKKK